MSGPQSQDSDSDGEMFRNESNRADPVPARYPWFGASTGLVAGAIVGATCCWLVEAEEQIELGAGVGSLIGLIGGAAIELWQLKRAGSSAGQADTGTFVCTLYACIPALLLFLTAIGGVQRKVTGLLMLGAVFGFPAAGALAGGLLDRLREGSARRPRR